MVASLLGITPERLRTLRRVHRKRTASATALRRGRGAEWWQCVDRLDDDELFAAFRRREVRARRISRVGAAAAIDRLPRLSTTRR